MEGFKGPQTKDFGSTLENAHLGENLQKITFLQCFGKHMLKILNKSSQAQANEIEEKNWKIKVWNRYPPSSKKSIFGPILASQNHGFFKFLAVKMKMVFGNKKQSKNDRAVTSQILPRAKALRPGAWGVGRWLEGEASSNMLVAVGPANFLILVKSVL